jgi:hypothetical protein
VSEAPAPVLPDLAEIHTWIGSALDDVGGTEAGGVVGVYADTEGRAPVWLIVTVARKGWRLPFARRRTKAVVVPVRECAAMPGRVWAARGRAAIGAAPPVDPSRPLLREHELTICIHYGIGEQIGRHAEVVSRPAGSTTAQPE